MLHPCLLAFESRFSPECQTISPTDDSDQICHFAAPHPIDNMNTASNVTNNIIKSENDKRNYRLLTLPNQLQVISHIPANKINTNLQAMLVSDPTTDKVSCYSNQVSCL